MAAAGEVKACHHLLQLSNIAVHMYHALQLMQVKVLRMKSLQIAYKSKPKVSFCIEKCVLPCICQEILCHDACVYVHSVTQLQNIS